MTRLTMSGCTALAALLLLSTASIAEPPKAKAKARDGGAINKAFVTIKKMRAEHVEEYSRELFTLTELAIEEGCANAGEDLLERIEKLFQPPRSRRKANTKSGVMVDKDEKVPEGGEAGDGGKAGEGDGEPGEITDIKVVDGKLVITRKPKVAELTPEVKEELDKVSKRVKELRERLKGVAKKGKAATKIEGKRKRATDRFVGNNKKLALKCVKKGFPAHGYELLLWTLQFDPENKMLRKTLLRQKPFKKDGKTRWYTPFDLKKAKKGYILHPEYGWVTESGLKALKAGKLFYKGKWMPKAYVEKQRQNWDNHWVYDTEHFEIHTNANLADAVEFGREVESLYAFFFRVFVDFYALDGPPDPKLVFGGGMQGKRLVLIYHRSRESFLEACRNDPNDAISKDPLIEESAGFYWGGNGKAYFYREPEGPNLSTIYHEVTHQIFGETYPDGPEAPTWLVEGLAVYLEDPVVRGEGGAERLLAGAEAPPGINAETPRNINAYMKETAERDVFHGSNRSANYATGGAVIHFMLHFRGGIYRAGFIKWAQEAYRNVALNTPTHIDKLYEYAQVDRETLQKDWEAFNRKPDLFDF